MYIYIYVYVLPTIFKGIWPWFRFQPQIVSAWDSQLKITLGFRGGWKRDGVVSGKTPLQYVVPQFEFTRSVGEHKYYFTFGLMNGGYIYSIHGDYKPTNITGGAPPLGTCQRISCGWYYLTGWWARATQTWKIWFRQLGWWHFQYMGK